MRCCNWFCSRRWLVFAAAAVFAGLAPVSAADDADDDIAAKPAGAADDRPAFVLIEAGDEPRQTLRLAYEPGATSTIVMVTDMTVVQQFGEFDTPPMKMPQTRITLELTVDRVDDEQRHHVNVVYTDWEVVSGPDVDPAMVAQRKQVYERLKGLNAAMIVDARGRLFDITFGEGKLDHPTLAGAVEDLTLTLQQLALPLPDDPVGIGAQWEARSEATVSGAVVTIARTLSLESIDEDTITITAQTTQAADAQPVDVPGIAPDTIVDLDLHKATGTGRFVLSLRGAYRITGETSTDLERVVTLKRDGQVQVIRQKVTMASKLEEPSETDDDATGDADREEAEETDGAAPLP